MTIETLLVFAPVALLMMGLLGCAAACILGTTIRLVAVLACPNDGQLRKIQVAGHPLLGDPDVVECGRPGEDPLTDGQIRCNRQCLKALPAAPGEVPCRA